MSLQQIQFSGPKDAVSGAVSRTTSTISSTRLEFGNFDIPLDDPLLWGAGAGVLLLLLWLMKR